MSSLYVLMTDQCQLNCPFCYCNFVPDMELNKNKNHIDCDKVVYMINNGFEDKKFHDVIFHGGEPLLYAKEINYILDRVKVDESFKTRFTIQTNLIYKELSQEQIKALARIGGYGTSYSKDRFYNRPNGEKNLKYFINNIQELDRFGIKGSLLITITELQINKMNPHTLKRFIDYNLPGINYIIFERPIFPMDLVLKNPDKYEAIYEEVDKYMSQCIDIFDRDKINLFDLVKNTTTSRSMYPTNCSDFTYTMNDEVLKFGCPSFEPHEKPFTRKQCLVCRYYKYCKSDCECLNYICAFPKKTFDKVKKICITENI